MRLLILTELKRNFSSLILWSSILIGLVVLMLSLYPVFKDSFAGLEDMLALYPAEFLEAFGMGENGLSMSDPYGWYGVEGYLFVMLVGGSYAAILGSSILSKEEDDQTIEFLLSKPISRNRILAGKSIVVFINLILLNLALGITTLIAFALLGDMQWLTWALYCLGSFLLQLVFASISFAMSIFVTKSRKVMSISLGLVIGMYAVDLIAKMTSSLQWLKYITPYEYVNAVSIVRDQRIDSLYIVMILGIMLVSGVIAWFFYNKKDISV